MKDSLSKNGDALCVRNLTKIYRRYESPLDRLKEFFVNGNRHSDFVALKDVSFSLKKGESLGVIGENGAGKSTLLQLIAGTLTPTYGETEINGTVLALLELGIGFHPEFTGRENIFFYGDLLGLPRRYIQSKYDEIVKFSELGSFIDMPLQTYSTGMQMRLAFSLISSLEPDILIIDEALSVGDLHFQKKCIDRIIEFKKREKTIVFCSHSTYQVGILCNRVIWLKNGMVEMFDRPEKVIPAYEFYQLEKDGESESVKQGASPSGDLPVIIREMELINRSPIKRGDDLKFRLLIESISDELPYNVTLSIKIESGWGVNATGTHLTGRKPLRGRKKEIIITYPNIPLLGGIYYAHARVFDDKGLMVYHEKVIPPFEITKESLELGFCYLENHWEIR
jgi:lipopolysaccharide transport system ATP-binding protein